MVVVVDMDVVVDVAAVVDAVPVVAVLGGTVVTVAEGTVKSRCSRGREAMAALLRERSGQP